MTPTGMHEARDGRPPETVDRILVGACGAIWLALIAISVIELLALIDLGRGQHRGEAESGHGMGAVQHHCGFGVNSPGCHSLAATGKADRNCRRGRKE